MTPSPSMQREMSNYSYERARMATFITWPNEDTVPSRSLAASAFIYKQGMWDLNIFMHRLSHVSSFRHNGILFFIHLDVIQKH